MTSSLECASRTGGVIAASCRRLAPAYCRQMVSLLIHSHTLSCIGWHAAREQEKEGQDGAGELDREALGALTFNDREARRKLNRAVHPVVFLELLRELLLHWVACKWMVVRSLLCHCCTDLAPTMATARSALKVVDMPLLFESGAYKALWPRVLVACSSEVQVRG